MPNTPIDAGPATPTQKADESGAHADRRPVLRVGLLVRLAVLALVTALVVAACGSDDDTAESLSDESSDSASANSSSSGSGSGSASQPSDADVGEEDQAQDGDGQGAAILITDDLGDVQLTSQASRIVTIGDEATELVAGLGLQPIGITSARLSDPNSLDGYYLGPDVIGTPELVGTDLVNLEAIAALEPDFIVAAFADDLLEQLQQIAPIAVYDIQVPGRWQEALIELGEATGTTEMAQARIDDYSAQVESARSTLKTIVAENPRLAFSYPNYRGGDDNFIFDENFAIASIIPELGFDLVGSEIADEAFPGVSMLSTERWGDLDGISDTLLALGPTKWEQTASATILETLNQPVLTVPLDEGRPSTGPISAPFYLDGIVTALTAEYG